MKGETLLDSLKDMRKNLEEWRYSNKLEEGTMAIGLHHGVKGAMVRFTERHCSRFIKRWSPSRAIARRNPNCWLVTDWPLRLTMMILLRQAVESEPSNCSTQS